METYIIYNSVGFIVGAGQVNRAADQVRINDGDNSTILGDITRQLADDPDLSVFYAPGGDPPDPSRDVMDIATTLPRPATPEELAQMPEGLAKARHDDAETRMQAISQMSHDDVDTWINAAFSQLPAEKQDALDWIDTNVTSLATAKTALSYITSSLYETREATRTLAHVLLAALRRLDFSE